MHKQPLTPSVDQRLSQENKCSCRATRSLLMPCAPATVQAVSTRLASVSAADMVGETFVRHLSSAILRILYPVACPAL